MHVLLVNDDGIQAEGIRTLALALARENIRVTVVAPASERSGAGHSISIQEPLFVRRIIDFPGAEAAYSLSGTPSDCARAGLLCLCSEKVDAVLSGINHGANLGSDCVYSGTVGAAMEAAMLGYPALAVSLCGRSCFDGAAEWGVKILRYLLKNPLNQGEFLNLNVPVPARLKDAPPRWAEPAPIDYGRSFEKRVSPRGQEYIWLYGEYPSEKQAASLPQPRPGTDLALTSQGYATLSVLSWNPSSGKQPVGEVII